MLHKYKKYILVYYIKIYTFRNVLILIKFFGNIHLARVINNYLLNYFLYMFRNTLIKMFEYNHLVDFFLLLLFRNVLILIKKFENKYSARVASNYVFFFKDVLKIKLII